MTCRCRLEQWQAEGVRGQLLGVMLSKSCQAGRIDRSRALLDSSPCEGPVGRRKFRLNPVDRARIGGERRTLTDAKGVPLVVIATAANTADATEALKTVMNAPPVERKRGRPKARPASPAANKAYDSEPLRPPHRWLGIEPRIPERGDDNLGFGPSRWAVERTIAWLNQFDRPRTRCD